MIHRSAFILLPVVLIFGFLAAVAQGDAQAPPVDEELFAQGEELYGANCAVCHQAGGEGINNVFPALAGNENLEDLSLIVTNVHQGRGAMPAFPGLDAEQIAALATYIRNAWENDFGGVAVEDVSSQLDEDGEEAQEQRSVLDGVYSDEQADRGEPIYTTNCSQCHGYVWFSNTDHDRRLARPRSPAQHLMLVSDPTLGPPLTGSEFLSKWSGVPVGSLFQYTRSSMPLDNPGLLSDQEYIDIIAFLFAANDIPAGEEELPPEPDELDNIVIDVPSQE